MHTAMLSALDHSCCAHTGCNLVNALESQLPVSRVNALESQLPVSRVDALGSQLPVSRDHSNVP
jgi:hypothetical protein